MTSQVAQSSQTHSLRSATTAYVNPWHKDPPHWSGIRTTTSSSKDVAIHTEAAEEHVTIRRNTLKSQVQMMQQKHIQDVSEREEYNSMSFLERSMYPSKPVLRAPDSAAQNPPEICTANPDSALKGSNSQYACSTDMPMGFENRNNQDKDITDSPILTSEKLLSTSIVSVNAVYSSPAGVAVYHVN
eukprot:m.122431 g.122431  ORF g.122431 m.122431 type:complete len:186 (-) comp17276_c0_seq1:340-897(-)